jgi:hypothetical protein
MRPSTLYKLLGVNNASEFFIDRNKDIVVVDGCVFGIYSDTFLSELSTIGSIPVNTILPLADDNHECVYEFLIESIINESMILLSDVDCLGFGKEFWLKFLEIISKHDIDVFVVARSSIQRTTSRNIDAIKSLWDTREIVYTHILLFSRQEIFDKIL